MKRFIRLATLILCGQRVFLPVDAFIVVLRHDGTAVCFHQDKRNNKHVIRSTTCRSNEITMSVLHSKMNDNDSDTNNNDSNDSQYKIQACQGPDCCKRWTLKSQGILETLSDFTGNTDQVEAISCTSRCDQGPNLVLTMSSSSIDSKVVDNIYRATGPRELADALSSVQPVSSKVVAAVLVMEKAWQATDAAQQERFYNSVISVMSSEDPHDLSTRRILARALVGRGQAHCDQGRFESASSDAQQALSTQGGRVAQAWRLQADACRGQGDVEGARHALQQWGHADPAAQKKIQGELARLLAAEG